MTDEQTKKPFPIEDIGLLKSMVRNRPEYSKCTENVYRILKMHPDFKDIFRYNAWRSREEIRINGKWRDMEDEDSITIQRQISVLYEPFRGVTKDMVRDAVISYTRDKSYDVAIQYLKSVEWDQEPRLGEWISKVYGTKNDAYHKAVGENFWKGMVKRIIDPGCKFDMVLILEGIQGCGKSTSLSIIAGEDWHLETTMAAENKDFFQQMQGKLIVEFAEGETLSRTETKKMKSVISTRIDTYRAPYGRIPRDYPRRCVFAMTTNNDEYLKDETGNRRFFPVEVVKEKIDLEWLKANRDQLFAEAYVRVVTLKESAHEYPVEEADRIRADKMVKSGFDDAIQDWLLRPIGPAGFPLNIDDNGITTIDVWVYALHGGKDRFPKHEEMRVAQSLASLGMEKRRAQINGVQKTRWWKSERLKMQEVCKGVQEMTKVCN